MTGASGGKESMDPSSRREAPDEALRAVRDKLRGLRQELDEVPAQAETGMGQRGRSGPVATWRVVAGGPAFDVSARALRRSAWPCLVVVAYLVVVAVVATAAPAGFDGANVSDVGPTVAGVAVASAFVGLVGVSGLRAARRWGWALAALTALGCALAGLMPLFAGGHVLLALPSLLAALLLGLALGSPKVLDALRKQAASSPAP